MQEKSLKIGYTSDIPASGVRGRNGDSQVIVPGKTCPISLQISEQDDISVTEQKVTLNENRRNNAVICPRSGPGGDQCNSIGSTHLKQAIERLEQNEDSDGESTYVKEIPHRLETHRYHEINCSDFPPGAIMVLLQIVKQYGWLKEELMSSDAKDIADRLYEDSENHLVMHEVERITDSSRSRREVVELLLKKVIRGKPATVVAFLTTLEKNRQFLHIGKRIKNTEVSDDERKKFLLLEDISSGRRPSTDTNHHFHLSHCDTEHLISQLYDKEIVDQLSDYLLSSFFISIRNHNSITDCNSVEDKIRLLVSLMMQCSDNVYDVMTQVLRKNNLEHILRGLERNRVVMVKRKSTDSKDTTANKYAKNEGGLRQIPTEVENQVVTLLRTEEFGNELNSQAVEQLGLEFSGAYKGSIVIRFTPKVGESWQKLKDSCVSGRIKEFLPHVFKGTGIESMLGEGEYRLKFSIFLMPCGVAAPRTQEASVSTDQNAVFKLDVDGEQAQSSFTRTSHRIPVPQPAKEDVKKTPDLIKEHWTLFVEELDPRKFINDLKKEGLIGEVDEDKMWDLDNRKDRMKFLLDKLTALEDGEKGYKILLEHCKEHSQYVLKKIEEKENIQMVSGDLDQSTLTGQKSERQSRRGYEMFFTGTIILNIHKRESCSPMKENRAPESDNDPEEDYEISFPDILDPICYFEERGDVPELGTDDAFSDFPKEVTMVFEDAWSAVGEKTERKILVGKRKRSKQPPESIVKRLESTPTTSTETNNADDDRSTALKDAKIEVKKGNSGDDENDNNKTKKSPRSLSKSSTT